jgi:hypothetical protein
MPQIDQVRCYQCGRVISVTEAVRLDVTTGRGHIWGSGASGWASSWTREDFCPECAAVRTRSLNFLLWGLLIYCGLLLLPGVLFGVVLMIAK